MPIENHLSDKERNDITINAQKKFDDFLTHITAAENEYHNSISDGLFTLTEQGQVNKEFSLAQKSLDDYVYAYSRLGTPNIVTMNAGLAKVYKQIQANLKGNGSNPPLLQMDLQSQGKNVIVEHYSPPVQSSFDFYPYLFGALIGVGVFALGVYTFKKLKPFFSRQQSQPPAALTPVVLPPVPPPRQIPQNQVNVRIDELNINV